MSNEVYANGMEVSCKAAAGKSICAFPDVCLTPPPPPAGPLPIPYPNTGVASDTDGGSKTVQISGQEVMLKDSSSFKKSTGDEAATKGQGMNVITHQIQGKCYFTAWSMDVKIEGENAVRHLDMMTHNHASEPGGTPPWPYMDEAAMKDPDHPCAKSGDKGKVEKNCGDPPEEDCSDDCQNARKCMLVPGIEGEKTDGTPKHKCCKGKTPHHPIPVGEFSASRLPGQARGTPTGNYDSEKAPAICVEGQNHNKEKADGSLKEHALCGRAFALERGIALYDPITDSFPDTYPYTQARDIAAKTTHDVTGCDEECLKRQLDDGHKGMVPPDGQVRYSERQKGGGKPTVKAARKARGI
ncbi:MAG: PAAR-like domain-containing protein [Isosphaeraceae bacterium]